MYKSIVVSVSEGGEGQGTHQGVSYIHHTAHVRHTVSVIVDVTVSINIFFTFQVVLEHMVS